MPRMADEESKGVDWMTPIGVLLFLALISRAILAIPETLEERYHIDLNDPAGSYRNLTTLTDDTPLNTSVKTIASANVFSRAGGRGVLRGLHAVGAEGVLTDGPVVLEGERWWFVDFASGADGWVGEANLENNSVFSTLDALAVSGMIISAFASVVFAVLITYLVIRLNQLRALERERLKAAGPKEARGRDHRWERIESLVESASPNDWRQAVLEADIMLDELVTRMGYTGESLGEKMKQIEKGDFYTLDSAWEAHKVRNRIAHEGGDYILTQREARRVIGLFRQVFDEFGLV